MLFYHACVIMIAEDLEETNMKITTARHKNRKKVLLLSLLVLILLAGALTAVYFWNKNNNQEQDSVNYSPPATEETADGQRTKDSTVNSSESTTSESTSSEKTPTNSSGETAPEAASLTTVTITSTNYSGSTYRVRAIIGKLTSRGTCEVALKQNGTVKYSNSASVAPMSSYSVCQGFDIDVSSLSSGSYTLSIDYKLNNTTQGSVQQEVQL